MAERSGIKFTPNDSPSLTSPEETNGAPRWCFNIANYLGVPGKGTDVALRMRTGWGAGQGHHTPRLGSDKLGWLGGLACPAAIKRETLDRDWRAMDRAVFRRGPEARVRAGAWRSTTLICLGYTVGLAARSGLCGRALAKITITLTSKETEKSTLDKNPPMTMELVVQWTRTRLKFLEVWHSTYIQIFDKLIIDSRMSPPFACSGKFCPYNDGEPSTGQHYNFTLPHKREMSFSLTARVPRQAIDTLAVINRMIVTIWGATLL